jgi:hypothetical protein
MHLTAHLHSKCVRREIDTNTQRSKMKQEFGTTPVVTALVAIVLMIMTSMSGRPQGEMAEILDFAKSNHFELREALAHYDHPEDSLKLKALEFLLLNMKQHQFVDIALFDSLGVPVEFDAQDYVDYDAARVVIDSLDEAHPGLRYGALERVYDVQVITADELIETVDLSFEAWQKPWSVHLDFDDFCEFVLPHRGSSEPLARWRPMLMARYDSLLSQMPEKDPLLVATAINKELREWFSFRPLYYLHPTDQSLPQMLESCAGRCEDMTNLAICALRANGVAVTSDYTPHWADTGNNHAWNAVLAADGEVVPFMGCEADPGGYGLRKRIAKVYRKTYSVQKGGLAERLGEESGPGWLTGKTYRDVTHEYRDVTDVHLDLGEQARKDLRFAYLCVFNSGKWSAIHWAELDNETRRMACFTDMGRDIIYLPMYYERRELHPAGAPFLLDEQGEMHPLAMPTKMGELSGSDGTRDSSPLVVQQNDEGDDSASDDDEPFLREVVSGPAKALLASTTHVTVEAASEGKRISHLTPGSTYEFFVWGGEGEWLQIKDFIATEESLLVQHLPSNALYWLIEKDGRKEERIFRLDEVGEQLWH